MKIHESVTPARVLRLAKKQMFGTLNLGICINCGKTQNGCEPDAEKLACDSCHQDSVYGAPQLLSHMLAHIATLQKPG